MIIGDRLREMREAKNFSQGEIEKRTGLLRCYISRVENGHTVPAIETLEKLARALEVPLYQLFYDGEEPPSLPVLPKGKPSDVNAWGSIGKDARFLKASPPTEQNQRRRPQACPLHGRENDQEERRSSQAKLSEFPRILRIWLQLLVDSADS